MKKRVMVAMSGGVDSSVAAALLKERGYEVIGVTLRLFPEDDGSLRRGCCLTEDIGDAQAVCYRLGIPHYVLNLEKQFREHVIDFTLKEYIKGRTPNPCLICNREVKFRILLQKALALGMDFLATGHYARIVFQEGKYHLLKAVDKNKDQSYFLFSLGQEEMKHLLFPLGNLYKDEVRLIARRMGLPVTGKAESQDLCFAPELRRFISEHLSEWRGEIVSLEGKKLGSHPGIMFFTRGQRRGLGIFEGHPLYVIHLDPVGNRVIVGPESALFASWVTLYPVHWTAGESPELPLKAQVRIRHRAPEVEAMIYSEDGKTKVVFSQPQRAPTPGQAAVFYSGEEVLGGGIIEEAENDARYIMHLQPTLRGKDA